MSEIGGNRMDIAFVVGEFPSLSETFILNQITGLLDRGHHVTIYAQRKKDDMKVHPDVIRYRLMDRCLYHRMPKHKVRRLLSAILLILKKPKLLKTLNPFKYGKDVVSLEPAFLGNITANRRHDIILCHFGNIGSLTAVVRDAGLIRGKLLTVFHGKDMTTYVRKRGPHAYDFLFRKGDLFLPISEAWKKKLIELGCDEHKIVVHRMGIETDKFVYHPRKLRGQEPVKLTSIARLVEKKGLEYGIRAIDKVRKKNPGIRYRIVGDGPLRKELEALVDQLGLRDVVSLLGQREQSEVVEILRDTHIFLAPSVTASDGDQEGIPVVLMEALSMGIPVVSTRHSGIPELVQDGVSGYLVPERDADALADRILELIGQEQVWTKMGYAGREHVFAHYNSDALNTRLESIFYSLLKGTRGHEHSDRQFTFHEK
jgi:colanic acid/amylovoran biosynthesis glycosyltransferase